VSAVKVLVTGATGFLGGYMVQELVRRGHDVTGMVRPSNNSRPDWDGRVPTRVADLTDAESLIRATEGMEAVIHLAAHYTFHGKKELYDKVTVGGTRSLLQACVRNGVKTFIYCSSTEAIGPGESPPADEDTPLRPFYEYGRSKVAAEEAVRESGASGIGWTIIRPSGFYGPGNVDDVAYWFITSFARNSVVTRFMVGSGMNLVQFVHARDAVNAFVLALENPKVAKGQTYVISDDHAWSYRDLYSMMAELCGRRPPNRHLPKALAKAMMAPVEAFNRLAGRESFMWHLSTVDSVTSDRSFSSAKAARELGYRPSTGLRDGLKETIAWYKANGYL
jgi:nucleoside-diphosphate-sugar epimerase